MSVKGFFIAIICVVVGGIGAYYSLIAISPQSNLPYITLIISFIAIIFGMGVFANRIKL
jgi:hypothetical protein